MTHYVKIENNTVTQCWDTTPPVNEAELWREAIEVRPAITAHRQVYTQHTFDLTKTPVEIVYGVCDVELDDRKAGMKANAAFAYQQEMQKQMYDPTAYDPAALQAAKDAVAPRVAAIEAATTHDELDALL